MYRSSMYNSARLPSIANYDMAKRIYQEAKPIRGRYPEERPLGRNRRYSWMQIHERSTSIEDTDNPLGQFIKTYACQLYQTDCVEFFPNGEVVIRVNQWRGPTTLMFINHTLKEYIGEIGSEGHKWYFINKNGEAYPMPTGYGSEMRVKFVDGYGFRPLEIKEEYKCVVRRKEMNKLRKYYSDFIEYGKTMLMADEKIGDWKFLSKNREELGLKVDRFCGYDVWSHYDHTTDTYQEVKIAEQRNRLMYLVQEAMEKNDLELKRKLMLVISATYSRYYHGGDQYAATPMGFANSFEEIMKYHHHDVVFERIPQPIGVPFRDRNDKYVP